jgi:hypothetical protein
VGKLASPSRVFPLGEFSLRAEGEKKKPSEITLAAAPIACASICSDQNAFC